MRKHGRRFKPGALASQNAHLTGKFAPVAVASAIAAAGDAVAGGTVGVLSARALLSVDAALLTLFIAIAGAHVEESPPGPQVPTALC